MATALGKKQASFMGVTAASSHIPVNTQLMTFASLFKGTYFGKKVTEEVAPEV